MEFEEFFDDSMPDPEYQSGIPENIIYQIEDGEVYIHGIFPTKATDSGKCGLVSCENDNGCLDYLISETHIGHYLNLPSPGYYVMENCEINYSQDYWGEYDCDMYIANLRPALLFEIPDPLSLRLVWNQLKLAWKHAQGIEL